MSTRWRCSPRLNTSPAACPTLSASSGVITPLARPRMPSVPKYLRAMELLRSPCAGYGEALSRARRTNSTPDFLKKRPFVVKALVGHDKTHRRPGPAVRAPGSDIASNGPASCPARDFARLRHVDGIGRRKCTFQPAFKRLLRPMAAAGRLASSRASCRRFRSISACDTTSLGTARFRSSICNSPAVDGPGNGPFTQTTRNIARAFPRVEPAGYGRPMIHAHRHLHRGPAAAGAPAHPEDVLRLCRGAAPMPRRRCAPTAPTWSASSCASACWSTSRSATSAPPSSASRCRCRSGSGRSR